MFYFPEGHPLEHAHLDNFTIHPHDTLRLVFDGLNTTFYVHLEPNTELIDWDIHEAVAEQNFSKDHDWHILSQTKAYKGTVFQPKSHLVHLDYRPHFGNHKLPLYDFKRVGEARIVIFDDGHYTHSSMTGHGSHFHNLEFQGSVHVYGMEYDVKTIHGYHVTKQDHHPSLAEKHQRSRAKREPRMVIIKGDEHTETPHSCGYKPNISRRGHIRDTASELGLVRRAEACGFKRKAAKIGIASDCNYVRKWNGKKAALKHATSLVNRVSGAYEKDLKISVTIGDSDFKTTCGQGGWNTAGCSGFTMENALNTFSKHIGKKHGKNISYFNLFSSCR
jgi:hypothetical protein